MSLVTIITPIIFAVRINAPLIPSIPSQATQKSDRERERERESKREKEIQREKKNNNI